MFYYHIIITFIIITYKSATLNFRDNIDFLMIKLSTFQQSVSI